MKNVSFVGGMKFFFVQSILFFRPPVKILIIPSIKVGVFPRSLYVVTNTNTQFGTHKQNTQSKQKTNKFSKNNKKKEQKAKKKKKLT